MVDLNAKALREAFGKYMTGVTIVTTRSNDGSLMGFTANSFTSVSLDPPLLLVCPGKHLSSFKAFDTAPYFAVNVLAENQEELSNHFASSKGDRFTGINWSDDAFGSPIFDNVAASFSCSRFERIDAGDHIVLIGRVHDFESEPVLGLGYADSGYFSLNNKVGTKLTDEDSYRFFAGAVVECDGHVLVQECQDGYAFPNIELCDRYRVALGLSEFLDSGGVQSEVGQTYSVFHDETERKHYTFFRAQARSSEPCSIGTFIPISQLEPTQFKQPGSSSMMRRFKSEVVNQQFGLFIGNSVSGDVRIPPTS